MDRTCWQKRHACCILTKPKVPCMQNSLDTKGTRIITPKEDRKRKYTRVLPSGSGSKFGPHLTVGWLKKYNYRTRTVVCIQTGHINTSNIDFLVERQNFYIVPRNANLHIYKLSCDGRTINLSMTEGLRQTLIICSNKCNHIKPDNLDPQMTAHIFSQRQQLPSLQLGYVSRQTSKIKFNPEKKSILTIHMKVSEKPMRTIPPKIFESILQMLRKMNLATRPAS